MIGEGDTESCQEHKKRPDSSTEETENTAGGACLDLSVDGALSAFLAGVLPEWVAQAGAAARRRAEGAFSTEAVIDAYLQYYARVAGGPGGG